MQGATERYSVTASFLEIATEQVVDLLAPGLPRLLLRADASDAMHAEHLTEEAVATGAPLQAAARPRAPHESHARSLRTSSAAR